MAVDNNNEDVSRSQMLLLSSSVCLVLAWISVSLRVWVRAVMIKSFGWDDSLMVLALVIFTVFCSSMIVMSRNGGGDLYVDPEVLPLLVKHMFIFETTYIGVMVVLKLSLGIFFLRIVVRAWQTFIIRAIILVVAMYSACYFFVALFQCGAPQNYLENRVKHHCVSDTVVLTTAYAHTAIGATTDWAFVILPIYIVWHANMSKRSKVSVAAILTLGALGSIATLVRFKYVPALIEYDHFWYSAAPLAVWSNIEPGLGIVAGSLATLRPLTRVCIGRARNIASEAQSVCRRHSRHINKSDDNNNSNSNNNDVNNTYQSKCAKASYDGRDWRSKRSNPLRALGYGRGTEITATTTITTTFDKNTNRNSCKTHDVFDISEKFTSSPGAVSEDSNPSRSNAGRNVVVQPYLYQYRQEQEHLRRQHRRKYQHQQWYDGTDDNQSRRNSGGSGSSSVNTNELAANNQSHICRYGQDANDHHDSNWPFRPDSAIYKGTDMNSGGEEV